MGRVQVFASIVYFAFFCGATAARADVIRITSGAVQAGSVGQLGAPWSISDEDELHLEGPGLAIVGSLVDLSAFLQLASPPTAAVPGSFDASGVLRVSNNFGALFNNAAGRLNTPFTMTFSAQPMRVACGTSHGVTECSGSAPFTFRSDLTFTPILGIDRNDELIEGTPVPLHLIGDGRVKGHVWSFNGNSVGSVRYDFAPTPEPATLSLFAAGALMAAGRWRRRRAGSNQS